MSTTFNSAFDDIVNSLEENKDKVAIIDRDGTTYTYADFKKMITGTRSYLASKGIKKGTKVLVFVSMSVELYAVLEALFSLGAVIIFLDPWMGGRKMNGIIREVKPELLILNKKAAKYSWLLPSTWFMKKWKIKDLPRNDDSFEIADIQDDDTGLVTFTSGSTGRPKGANRTYGYIDAQAKALKSKLIGDPTVQNIDYTNLPIVGLAGFAIGNTVVIPNINLMKIDKVTSHEVNEQLNTAKVNRLIVSPALLNKVLEELDPNRTLIKKVVTGGAPVSPKTVIKCVEQFPAIEFESMYGSTEVEPISGAPMPLIYNLLKEPLKGVFVGNYDDRLKLSIVTPRKGPMDAAFFEAHQLNEGEIGEIVVTGTFVNKSYYNNEQAFRRYKIVASNNEIWHRTGDIGYLENGNIYLVGRENRIIESGGKNYYPYPIEQYLQMTEGIEDVGYVQAPTGEVILYIGSGTSIDQDALAREVKIVGYPLDEVKILDRPLPRDPRHKSKLLIEELSNK